MSIPEATFLDNFQVVCAAISVFSSMEMLALCFSTFSRFNTLYFWSILACASGCLFNAAGVLDFFYQLYVGVSSVYRPLFLYSFGWYFMVTGYALVLWSHVSLVHVPAHFIVGTQRLIVANALVFHLVTTVLLFGSWLEVDNSLWLEGFIIVDDIQRFFFSFQEVLMLLLLMRYSLVWFRQNHSEEASGEQAKKNAKRWLTLRQHLIFALVLVGFTVAMVVCEYALPNELALPLKATGYAIKLKLVFYIFSRLSVLVNTAAMGNCAPASSKQVASSPRQAPQ